MKKRSYNLVYIFIIISFIAFYFFYNKILFTESSAVESNDPDPIYQLSCKTVFYEHATRIFESKEPVIQKISNFLFLFNAGNANFNPTWPRFYYLTSSLLNFIFGNSTKVSIMINIIYFSILIFSIYLIGTILKNKNAGILAVALILFYPGVFKESRVFTLDFSLMAMTTLCFYLLLRIENFNKLKKSLFFGLILGIGFITKGQFIFFIAGPLSCRIYAVFNENKIKAQHLSEVNRGAVNKALFIKYRNLIFAILLALLVSSIYWFGSVVKMEKIFLSYLTGAKNDAIFKTNSLAILFYPMSLLHYMSFLYFSIFLLFFSLFINSNNEYKYDVISYFLVPLWLFTLIQHRDPGNILPLLPITALISSIGILELKQRMVKIALVVFLVCFGFINFLDKSYNFDLMPETLEKFLVTKTKQPKINYENTVRTLQDFVEVINLRVPADKFVRVAVVTIKNHSIDWRFGGLGYYLKTKRKNIGGYTLVLGANEYKELLSYDQKLDFIILIDNIDLDIGKPLYYEKLNYYKKNYPYDVGKIINYFKTFKIIEKRCVPYDFEMPDAKLMYIYLAGKINDSK